MTQIKKLVAKLKRNPNDVKFDELAKVCDHYFGEPRQQEVTLFTKPLGVLTLGSTFKTKKEKLNPIK